MSATGADWRDALELPEACAVAAGWIGGAGAALQAAGGMPLQQWQLTVGVRLDNHWAAAAAVAAAMTEAEAVAEVLGAAESGSGVDQG